jgi:acyl carrier protein
MIHAHVAERIERFVRTQFRVAAGDARFSRSQPLFELGYVDSVGVVELLAFVTQEFRIEVPDEMLTSEEFSTIDGIAAIVCRLTRSPQEQSLPGSG